MFKFNFIGSDTFWSMWKENLVFSLYLVSALLVVRLVYLFFKEK